MGYRSEREGEVRPQVAHEAKLRGTVERPRSRDIARAKGLRALIGDRQVVYAVRLPDGLIKIGCTSNLVNRRRTIASGSEIIAFRFGELDDEQAVHERLIEHRARGREYYRPTPEVLAVVNEMRRAFRLPDL